MCKIHQGNELKPGKYNVYELDSRKNKLSEEPALRGVRACVNCLASPFYLHVPVVDAFQVRRYASEVANYTPGIELSQTRGDKLNN